MGSLQKLPIFIFTTTIAISKLYIIKIPNRYIFLTQYVLSLRDKLTFMLVNQMLIVRSDKRRTLIGNFLR